MTHSWTTKFNVSPSGSDFGSVSGRIIRETKEAFYERFEVQHVITESATPQVTHEGGKSSVIKFGTSEEELEHFKPQSLFYDVELNKLYTYNKDAVPDSVTSTDHSDYDNLDADDHTQYAQELADITGALTTPEIKNIGTSASTPYLLDEAVHTASDHYPIEGDSSYAAPLEKLSISNNEVTGTAITLTRYDGTVFTVGRSATISDIPIGVMFAYLDAGGSVSRLMSGYAVGSIACALTWKELASPVRLIVTTME